MTIRDRAYYAFDDNQSRPVVVLVIEGTTDVQAFQRLLHTGDPTHRDLDRRLTIRLARNRDAAGTEELLDEYGGPIEPDDLTDQEPTDD